MQDPSHLAAIVAWAAFALAFAFGWFASQSHFCTMGAVSDIVTMGDWSRMRMWLLAMAVAMIATNLMILLGWIDLSKSLYTGERFIWLSHILGGTLFGVGMTIASGCGARNLVRLGGGNLKSLVVLLCLGLSAYMTLRGLFAPVRVNYVDVVSATFQGGQDLPQVLSGITQLNIIELRIACISTLGVALLVFVLRDREFCRNHQYVMSGLVIGTVVAAGWYVTAHVGYLAEDPNTLSESYVGTSTRRPESFTFVSPVAYGLELLLLWTDASLRVTFGIATVIGMFLGALSQSIVSGNARWEGFTSVTDLRNHVIGGVLMGVGGVTALGCTIGNGITGVSTLALGSFLTLASLIFGSVITIKWLYWRMETAMAINRSEV